MDIPSVDSNTRSLGRLFPSLLILALCSANSVAAVIEIEPSRDNKLHLHPEGLRSSGSGLALFAGRTGHGPITRAVLAFDVSKIPPSATINSVTLSLNQANTNNRRPESRAVSIHRLNRDWGEGASNGSPNANNGGGNSAPAAAGDATWLHAFFDAQFWENPGGDFQSTASASLQVTGNGLHTWQSTPELVADVQVWVENQAANFGWILRGEEDWDGVSSSKRFNSREAPALVRPKLTIHFSAPDDVEVEGQLAAVFPQFVNGQTEGVLNRSRIILCNSGDFPANGVIRFRAPSLDAPSEPTYLPIGGQLKSKVEFELEPWGTLDFETDGTGQLQTGVIEIFDTSAAGSPLEENGSNSDLEGTEIFTILGSFVSVGNSKPQSSSQIYVSRNESENTGIAIYNPDAEETTTLELALLDNSGVLMETIKITVAPKQHMALFVDDEPLFGDFFLQNPGDFEGTMNIHVVSGSDISIVTLLQQFPSGALIAVSPSSRAFKKGTQ